MLRDVFPLVISNKFAYIFYEFSLSKAEVT